MLDQETMKMFIIAHKVFYLNSRDFLSDLYNRFMYLWSSSIITDPSLIRQSQEASFKRRIVGIVCAWVRLSPNDFNSVVMISLFSLWHATLQNSQVSDEKSWAKELEKCKNVFNQTLASCSHIQTWHSRFLEKRWTQPSSGDITRRIRLFLWTWGNKRSSKTHHRCWWRFRWHFSTTR